MATIVFDIGSSSVRAAAFHDDRMIPGTLARESMALSGEGEGDAREILALLEACLDRCLAALRRAVGPPRVAAIGFTSFAMSWLGVDGDGEPVTPVYTYCRRSPRASRSCAIGGSPAPRRCSSTRAILSAKGMPAVCSPNACQSPSLAAASPSSPCTGTVGKYGASSQ